ncbi:MAG: HDOD domain-containing protein [Pirellulaceae bacterium]
MEVEGSLAFANWENEFGEAHKSRFLQHALCPYTSQLGKVLAQARVRHIAEPEEFDSRDDLADSPTDLCNLQQNSLLELGPQIEFPAVPAVMEKLRSVLGSPDASFKEVAAVVALDPALASRVLGLVNSAIFGLKREVTSVEQAVSFIGINEIRNLTVTVSVVGAFESGEAAGFPFRKFWSHSITVAIASRIIAKTMKETGNSEVEPEEAFLAGLMHDIGRVLIGRNPELQQRVNEKVSDLGISYQDAELSVLGFQHTDLGHRLLSEWGLSQSIQHAALHHHSPTGKGDYAAIVNAADAISHGLGFYTHTDSLPRMVPEVWSFLGLKDCGLEIVAKRMLDQFSDIEDVLLS